jgi:hypothetical protein
MDIEKKKIIKRTKKISNDNELNNLINKFSNIDFNDKILKQNAIKIQKIFRGYIYRVKHLPIILYVIQNYLKKNINILSNISKDGRINSVLDEDKIINLIEKKYKNNIRIPKERNWFDIVIKDYYYGWIPVNIKTSKCSTSDNTGNLAMCVYLYTNENLELNLDKTYNNGEMSKILISKLEKKEYNKINKKDYYFIVVNKTNTSEIIINSVKGLKSLTPNINNLPFQVRWDKNKNFEYKKISKCIKQFVDCIKKPNPSWSEIFLTKIRTIDV